MLNKIDFTYLRAEAEWEQHEEEENWPEGRAWDLCVNEKTTLEEKKSA